MSNAWSDPPAVDRREEAEMASEYEQANTACRVAFENEDGCGNPEANPQRYRIFRDGFFAAWNLRKP